MTLRTPGYRLVAAGLFLVWTVACAGALVEPPIDGNDPLGVGLTAIGLVLTVRAWRLGVVLAAEEVRVRSLWRSYRLPLRTIAAVSPVPYDGLWRLSSTRWSTLRIETKDGRGVTAYGLLSRRWRELQVIAGQIRDAAGLPPGRTLGDPAHSIDPNGTEEPG
jgi:hypothetical protein